MPIPIGTAEYITSANESKAFPISLPSPAPNSGGTNASAQHTRNVAPPAAIQRIWCRSSAPARRERTTSEATDSDHANREQDQGRGGDQRPCQVGVSVASVGGNDDEPDDDRRRRQARDPTPARDEERAVRQPQQQVGAHQPERDEPEVVDQPQARDGARRQDADAPDRADHQHQPAGGIRRHPERHDQADDAERSCRRQQHQLAPRLPGSVGAVDQPHRDLDDPDERDHGSQGEDAPRQEAAVRRRARCLPHTQHATPARPAGSRGSACWAEPGASTTYRDGGSSSGSTFDQSIPAHGS